MANGPKVTKPRGSGDVFFGWGKIVSSVYNIVKFNVTVTDGKECKSSFVSEWVTSFKGTVVLCSILKFFW